MSKIKKTSKFLLCVSVISAGLSSNVLYASASEDIYANKIIKMEPSMRKDELVDQAKELAKKERKSKQEILKNIYLELKKDEKKSTARK